MFQPARGTRDFLPEEMRKRNWVLDNIRTVFEIYGYEPLGTPAFENWDMLKIKSGEDIINQIYYFKDKSKRELGLRFEWTASLARVVANHRELPRPFKRYAIGPVWRYERPSEMSRREFWQMDVDIVGVSDPIADTEVIAVAVDSLKRLGFKDFVIRLNDRRLLEALVKVADLPENKYLDIFRAIDKRDKIGDEKIIEELEKIGASLNASKRILDLTSTKGEPSDTLEKTKTEVDDALGIQACEILSSIFELSKIFGIDEYLIIDLGLARGLDYYTGPVFEVYAKGYEDAGSIAGGGRYDEIVHLFGGDPTPMTGISMGVDRLVPLLDKMGIFKNLDLGPKIYVATATDSVKSKGIEIAQFLRRAGVSTEQDLITRGLRKQLDNANKKGFKKVVIVGEKELIDNCVLIKDMTTAKQYKVNISKLLDHI
jgi:histidyl-tRNA synthetase